jgi:hypothetical protein
MIAAPTVQLVEQCLLLQEVGARYLVFEYLYRDSGNYKVFGELWLTGSLTEKEQAELVGDLESEEFFVAEQLGVPPLYEGLFKMTGGRIQDDHAWHTFAGFRGELELPSGVTVWGKSADLLAAIVEAQKDWKPQLSANFVW